jgi:ABC-type uncharacterized transport system substrate-binding protein
MAALAAPAHAAQVVVLKSSPPADWAATLDALKAGLIGHSVTEHDFQGDRAAAALALSAVPPEAIVVAVGPLATQLARELAPGLALVYCMVPDPAALGLTGAARTAGVALSLPIRNQLAAFRAVYPRAVRLGVLHGPAAQREVAEAQKAAVVVRMVVIPRPITSEREASQALRGLLKEEEVDAVWMPADPLFEAEELRRALLDDALDAGKPVFAYSASVVAEGALASNGADLVHMGERVATLVSRMAEAAPDAKIGTMFARAELAINKKVAGQLKIEVPPDVLGAAQKVY